MKAPISPRDISGNVGQPNPPRGLVLKLAKWLSDIAARVSRLKSPVASKLALELSDIAAKAG